MEIQRQNYLFKKNLQNQNYSQTKSDNPKNVEKNSLMVIFNVFSKTVKAA